MSGRRSALETNQSCSVVYPAGLFSLEKDEVYPYERFAYSLLDVAVEALHHQNLSGNISVEFDRPALAGSPTPRSFCELLLRSCA